MESAIIFVVVLVIYFIPAGLAQSRKHKSASAITLVNLLFGWTLAGWLWALIWANTGNVEAKATGPSPETHVKCPDCAELVLKDAKVCKHCGCRLVPQS